MEKYNRRLRARIDIVPKQHNEKAEDVFKFVKDLVEEFPDLELPEVVTDRAHKIGPNKKCRKCVSLLLFAFDLPSSYNILLSPKVYRKQSTG